MIYIKKCSLKLHFPSSLLLCYKTYFYICIGKINVTKLSKYLKLSAGQHEEVANICEYFSTQMGRATTAKKDQEKKLHNAVYGNLKLMKKTLTDKQYADYAKVLNVTLQNKGIEVK